MTVQAGPVDGRAPHPYRAVTDPIRAEAARSELDWLLAELGHATGLAGRSRTFPTDAERARSSVQKAIRRTLVRIGTADPEIRAYLEATLVTGIRCSYRPSPA